MIGRDFNDIRKHEEKLGVEEGMKVVLIVLGLLLLGWEWVKLCSEGHHILGLIIGRMKGLFKIFG